MKDGFIAVGVATPRVAVADCPNNAKETISMMKEAEDRHLSLLVFPELHLTSYTCGDLFLQDTLLTGALNALFEVVAASEKLEVVTVVGLPLKWRGKLYNVAVVVHKGVILGCVPKTHIPNYQEFYESRWFSSAPIEVGVIHIGSHKVPFGTQLIFRSNTIENFRFSIEICEDLWAPLPPSTKHALQGALIIANLSASDELVGKASYREQLVQTQSARLLSGYLYASAGRGESTTDMVFCGHNLIAENGVILAQTTIPFEGILVSEIDVDRLASERRRNTTFTAISDPSYKEILFDTSLRTTKLTRLFSRHPFVPSDETVRDNRCRTIIAIQSLALAKRLEHTKSTSAVIGISGGLDSTLALLVTVEAFDRLHLDRSGIIAITMPCFGTTQRTKTNAEKLAFALHTTLKTIDITDSVRLHFQDIGHDETILDVTYENSQARERTQVLMDIANSYNALVIGTGDLSELALGWATYNGDHMSMYGVNASVPKTLIRYLVAYYAHLHKENDLSHILYDILNTPVSPELLPSHDGNISQVTEDILGPYELHDFFLYYALRWSYTPKKILRIASIAYEGIYASQEIQKTLRLFYRRFFSQQFKRSCLPDGPKVGSVSLSPRGDWRMPSDAVAFLWLQELSEI